MIKRIHQIFKFTIAFICLTVIFAPTSTALAQSPNAPAVTNQSARGFIVKDIEIEGLERVEAGTIFVALPLRVGDLFDVSHSPEILKTIYDLRLFDDVKLKHNEGKLIIKVVERPGIAEIIIDGNEVLPTEGMIEGLKSIGISKGSIYDRTVFDRLQEELKQQYYALGKYSVKLAMEAVKLPKNKVNLEISIIEGESTRIRKIKIIGNKHIDTETLTEDFQSGLREWYDVFGDRDLYSKVRLEADLESLKNVYYNRGYLDADVDDVQVTLTPDKKYINIVVQLNEGDIYKIKDVNISRKKIKGFKKIENKLEVKKGQIFSREKAIVSNNTITNFLKDEGYAFAQVSMVPQKNQEDSTINLLYVPEPKELVYVHRINFSNSTATDDAAFRSQLRQLESAPYSQHDINLSRKRLQRLPYVTAVEVVEKPVEGTDNQIDIDFKVLERQSGSFNIGAGYSAGEGAVLSLNVTQDNFLGTGDRVRFAFSNSSTNERYGISIFNPNFTVDGISRSWQFNYVSTDFRDRNTAGSGSDELSAGINFGIPVSEEDTLGLGLRIQNIHLDVPTESTPDDMEMADMDMDDMDMDDMDMDDMDMDDMDMDDMKKSEPEKSQVEKFLDDEGRSFTNFILESSLTYDTRDRSLFTTSGLRIRGSLELFTPFSDLTYAKVNTGSTLLFPSG